MNIFSSHLMQEYERLYVVEEIDDLRISGLYTSFTCPNDATDEALYTADYISAKKRGYDCAEDNIVKTSKIQGKWLG
ncbi:MAG TPA: hypothetical protein PKC30_11830 [Saprospiraceae bacterium]|nr:hypothetical protein [Saprospiraceae bacterium]